MHNPAQSIVGPGSQPASEDDDSALSYMEMPSGMTTFSLPELPETEEAAGCDAALAVLEEVRAALDDTGARCLSDRAKQEGARCLSDRAKQEGARCVFDVTALDATNRAFVGQVLGEGEVSIIAGANLQAQESVLAGVWRLHTAVDDGALASDSIVVGAFPDAVLEVAASSGKARLEVETDDQVPPGVANAPALLSEIAAALAEYAPGKPQHVINLSLLPHTEGDLAFLVEKLGRGQVTVLSRGYGNCRISSTGTANVWWVQYFNSQDTLILNTLEVVDVPEVALAAPEDLADSAERLGEILQVYK